MPMKFAALLRDLTDVSSTTEKTKIIGKYLTDGDTIELLRLALSSQVTFGIKEFDMPTKFSAKDDDINRFFGLVDALQARSLTGDAARAEITSVLSRFSEPTADALARVLRRRLKVDIGISLINKAANDDIIEEFKAMKGPAMKDNFKWNAGPWFVEWKYDGMRLIVLVEENGDQRYYSYEGNEQQYVPQHIMDGVRERAAGLGAVVFDSEVFGNNYTYTMKAMKAAHNPSADLRMILFDVIPMDEWLARKCKLPFDERRAKVEAIAAADGGAAIVASRGKVCNNRAEVEKYYLELVAAGAEGAMIKTLKHKYEWKRSSAWTKYKPFYSADLECYEIYEGAKGTECEGTLGGMKMRGHLEDGTYVECDCGGGFPFKAKPGGPLTRDQIWANPKLVLGYIHEVQYQEVTQAQTAGKPKSLRFVTYLRPRPDKTRSK
jgi:ATP-dependent DNA ligase